MSRYTESIAVTARRIVRIEQPGEGTERTLELDSGERISVGAGWFEQFGVAIGKWLVESPDGVRVLSDASFRARFQPDVATLAAQSLKTLSQPSTIQFEVNELQRQVAVLKQEMAHTKSLFDALRTALNHDVPEKPATQSMVLPGIESIAKIGMVGAPPPGMATRV